MKEEKTVYFRLVAQDKRSALISLIVHIYELPMSDCYLINSPNIASKDILDFNACIDITKNGEQKHVSKL